MITAVANDELNRINERRPEEISPRFLESLEEGYYEEGEETAIFFKGNIPAAQLQQLARQQVVLVSGKYRIITIPIGAASLHEHPARAIEGGPTGEPVFRFAYPANVFERRIPAAFPASLWLNEALEFEKSGRRDRALDIIFAETDKLLRKGEFDACNRLLQSLDVDHLSINLLIAFLTITLPAHESIPAREVFYSRVERRLDKHPNKAKLLSGLRGPSAHGPR